MKTLKILLTTLRAWTLRKLLKKRILTLEKLDTHPGIMEMILLEGTVDSEMFTYVGKGKYLRKKSKKIPKLTISGMNSVNDFLL